MKPIMFGRVAVFVAAVILAACTTDDGNSQGLLNNGTGTGTSTTTPDELFISVTGPNDSPSGSVVVDSGCEQTGFVVKLVDGQDKPVPNAFVRIRPDEGQINTGARDNVGGVTTSAQGSGSFRFLAPDDVSDTTDLILTLSATVGEVSAEPVEYTVSVVPGPPPQLSLFSPSSISPTPVSASDLLRGFEARVNPGVSCRSRASRFVTLTLSPMQGFVNAPQDEENSGGGLTGSSGTLRFDYQAPDTVPAATTVTITGSVTVGGQTDTDTVRVRVLPPVLGITGPSDAAPGRERNGFVVTLRRSDGTAIEGERVAIATTRGTISDKGATGTQAFTTDAFGRVPFSLTPPTNINEPTTITITAEAETQQITDSFVLTVQPDTFLFTSPDSGTPIQVGVDNRFPLAFNWRTATSVGSTAVQGTLRLTTDSTSALFVVNDDPQNPVDTVIVNTDASGDFKSPVAIYDNNSEFVTITARDENATQRTTTLTVQFVDRAGRNADYVFLNADPLEIETSVTERNSSDLEFTVLNEANQPIAGHDVTFSLVRRASGDNLEKVFPGGGTTDGNGTVLSEYFSGKTPGTATVRACVVSNGVCEEIDITVVNPPPATP